MCIIGYLLTVAAYTKARRAKAYKKNIDNFMEDLRGIRLACRIKKKGRKYVRGAYADVRVFLMHFHKLVFPMRKSIR